MEEGIVMTTNPALPTKTKSVCGHDGNHLLIVLKEEVLGGDSSKYICHYFADRSDFLSYCHLKDMVLQLITYMVSHLLEDLDRFELDLGFTPWLVACHFISTARCWNIPNQCQPNQGALADQTLFRPTIYFYK